MALLIKAPSFREKILLLQKEHPEYLERDETYFRKEHKDVITLTTLRMRIALWQEYEMAFLNNRNIRISQVYAGICNEKAFYRMINNPARLGFVLTAPTDYTVTVKEAHEAGLDKLREIFTAKVVDEEGYLNPKAAEIVIKAFALIDARLKGAIVQRVDQRVLTASVSAKTAALPAVTTDMDLLDYEIQKAREQIARLTVGIHNTPKHSDLVREMNSKDIEYEEKGNADLSMEAKSGLNRE